ncbi:hypothetical protein EV426DRAFT_623729 [Tirmania nivea]|nr:hypothetical protein EV426DRAFT_623729 [Tirmania nivea]
MCSEANSMGVPRRIHATLRTKKLQSADFLRQNPSDKHRFVELIGVSVDETYSYIAEEYMVHGDLKGYMDFSWPEGGVKIVALQLLEALKLMHDHQRLHFDLRPAAKMVDSGLRSVISALADLPQSTLTYLRKSSLKNEVEVTVIWLRNFMKRMPRSLPQAQTPGQWAAFCTGCSQAEFTA